MAQSMGRDNVEATSMCQLLVNLWPLLLGNVLEWYDFGIYSFLAPNIKVAFFHSSSISTWAGYTVTFLLRPFGGLVNGWIADNYGRRVSILVSIIGMLAATVGQGLLPAFNCCGDNWGTVGLALLLLLRALQGLSAGGELGPIVSYFAESAPPNRTCAATGLLLSSAGLGFLSANLLVTLVVDLLSPEEMAMWGWRIPFLVSLVPGSIALWGRSKLAESAEFVRMVVEQQQDNLDNQHITEDGKPLQLRLRDHTRALLVGFLSTCNVAVAYYSGLWCPSYLKSRGLDGTSSLVAGCFFTCIVMVTWMLLPLLNDLFCRIDPLKIMLVGSLGSAVVSFPVWYALNASSSDDKLTWMSFLVLGIYGLAIGIAGSHMYVFVADLFPTHLRALGFGMSFNAAMAFVGGSTPLINASLLETEWDLGVGLYWSVMAIVSALATTWGIVCRRSGTLPSHLLSNKENKEVHAKTALGTSDSGEVNT